MGTRSLVVFEDEVGEEICVVYRQFDGYPEGRGKELFEFIDGRKLVNGFGNTDEPQSNGVEDLIAQWIAYEKNLHGNGPHKVGNVYVFPPNTRDMMEEYIYTIRPNREDGHFDLTSLDVYRQEYILISTLTNE